jgi:hypothetical protein
MNTTGALMLGIFVAVGATTASGQEQYPMKADTNQQIGASTAEVAPEPSDQQSRPLFTIGGLPVRAWAPVESHYNAAANRNLAADPLWGPGF